MIGRRWYAVASLPLLAACADERATPAAPEVGAAAFRVSRSDVAEPIPGQYIVVLRDLAPAVAALYLQGNPGASPATVTSALLANATTNRVTSAGRGSPNRLLFTNY